jgi:hypothetical protein
MHQTLTATQRRQFLQARDQFFNDLVAGQGFRKSLRIKGVQGKRGEFELSWSMEGRAVFAYGESKGHGPHIIWLRIGDHSII